MTTLKSPLSWVVCFTADGGPAGLDASSALGRVPVACLVGTMFIAVLVISLPLVVGSVVVMWRLRETSRTKHQHRQLLFCLLAIVGTIRALYAIISLIVLSSVDSVERAERARDFFARTFITATAAADVATCFIDVLLTVYWLLVLQRISVFPKRILLMCCVGMAATFIAATFVDFSSGGSTDFNYTFFTVAMMLFFTSLMHLAVIVEVLIRMLKWFSIVNNKDYTGSISSEVGGSFSLSARIEAPSVTSHFVLVTLIAISCLICWAVRSVMLLGRASSAYVFVTGGFSFANDKFTFVYLTVLTLLPCVAIAIVFAVLSIAVIQQSMSETQKPSPRSPVPSSRLLSETQ